MRSFQTCHSQGWAPTPASNAKNAATAKGWHMDHYHTWFDLKPDIKDLEFAQAMARYIGGAEAKRRDRRLEVDATNARLRP